MLKIGDFSRLAHVTVKALRHYDRLGLLKPAWIDRFTGYRYYALEQLPRLNRVLTLKDLGFSLDQIGRLIAEDLSPAQLRGMLRLKQAELEAHLEEEQDRLAQVEARLRQIETEGCLPSYDVVVKRVLAQRIACRREIVASLDQLSCRMAVLRAEVESWLQRTGSRMVGPWFSIFYNPEYAERNIDYELAVAVEPGPAGRLKEVAETARNGLVILRILAPVETMASVFHTGSLDTTQAYTALYTWMQTNGYRSCAPGRELYLQDEAASAGTTRVTEVQMPVEKATAPGHTNQTQMNTDQENDMELKPKFVTRPALMVVGPRYVGKNLNQEIKAMWEAYLPHIDDLPRVDPAVSYGVCGLVKDVPEGEFEYVAGVEVSSADQLPEGMVIRMVPAHRYAVFGHVGSQETLQDTYNYVYQTWFPQSGYKLPGFDMEVYDEEFRGFSPDSVLNLYFPID